MISTIFQNIYWFHLEGNGNRLENFYAHYFENGGEFQFLLSGKTSKVYYNGYCKTSYVWRHYRAFVLLTPAKIDQIRDQWSVVAYVRTIVIRQLQRRK